MIHVTPFSRLDETLRRSRATHLIALASPGKDLVRPVRIDEGNWLALQTNDIAQERDGLVAPNRGHVEAVLDFARSWGRSGPLVVSCYAGVSRSTAVAYVIAAALQPERDELELAQELRLLSPSATPNPLIVVLADGLLDRRGRMVAAIRSIGRGAEAYEGTPFLMSTEGVGSNPWKIW